MLQLKWVLGVGTVLIALPFAAAFLFPPPVAVPVPEPPFTSPKIVYRLPPTQPNDLSGVARHVGKGWVTLRADTYWDTPGYAMHTFNAALKAYPQARRIRVSWHMLEATTSVDSTAVYDRRRRAVSFYSESSGDLGTSRDHVRYASVPEAVFVKLADAHRDDRDETSGGGFKDLPNYGCRKRDLGSWSRDPPG